MFINKSEVDYIFDVLKSKGFNDDQIKRFCCRYNKIKDRIDDISESYDFYHEQMVKLGYAELQIIELVARYPRVVFAKFTRHRFRKEYVEYLKELKSIVVEDIKLEVEMEEVKGVLEDLGLPQKHIDHLFRTNSPLIYKTKKELLDNILFLNKNGLSNEKIKEYLAINARVLEYSESDYTEIKEAASYFDISLTEIFDVYYRFRKSCKSFINFDKMLYLFNWAKLNNIDPIKFKKSYLKNSVNTTQLVNRIDPVIESLTELGFSTKASIRLLGENLMLLTLSKEAFRSKFDILLEFGISDISALNMISTFPEFFTMSEDNIREKLEVASHTNSLFMLEANPKNLIQSAKLTKARHYYIVEVKGYPQDYSKRALYRGQKQFEDEFHANNEQVIEYYNSRKALAKK